MCYTLGYSKCSRRTNILISLTAVAADLLIYRWVSASLGHKLPHSTKLQDTIQYRGVSTGHTDKDSNKSAFHSKKKKNNVPLSDTALILAQWKSGK